MKMMIKMMSVMMIGGYHDNGWRTPGHQRAARDSRQKGTEVCDRLRIIKRSLGSLVTNPGDSLDIARA